MTLVFSCSLFLVLLHSEAQNLVPNPSFELHDTCPYLPGFGSKPLYWDRWDQDPEYFHACVQDFGSGDSLLDVPQNGMTFQYAQDGEGYVGGATFEGIDNIRELLGAPLIQPLQIGQTYYASFYTNMAANGNEWAVGWASNNQGLLFTMEEHLWSGGGVPEFATRNYAQVNSTAVIADTVNWVLVSGSFVADSAYEYVVIGNFFDEALTDTSTVLPISAAAYYLYDQVCVSESLKECPLVQQMTEQQTQPIVISPNPVLDMLHISLPKGTWEVVITDAIGRICLSEMVPGGEWEHKISRWNAGRYLASMISTDGRRYRSSFVIVY